MITLITGSLILSVLHALIPNHWLPVLAISKKENWTLSQTTFVTLISGLAHALSTVLIGVAIAVIGVKLSSMVENFTHYIAPGILVGIGLFYIYQHHRHKHFHLHAQPCLSPLISCTNSEKQICTTKLGKQWQEQEEHSVLRNG